MTEFLLSKFYHHAFYYESLNNGNISKPIVSKNMEISTDAGVLNYFV